MSTLETSTETTRRPFSGRRLRLGDLIIQVVAGAAALTVVVIVVAVAIKLIQGAKLSMSTFGLSFLTTQNTWDTFGNRFGALNFIYGTAITSLGALVIATPLAIGIALFLTELAPTWVRGPVTALVETLAAIPSVIIGLWGIVVLAPLLVAHVNPFLHHYLGFIPFFGPPPQGGSSLWTAIIVLTIMVLPIITSITRELFLRVPPELKEGALGLGVTRWEMIRGVVLPYSRSGIAAAMILGLGRAVGEAIAVVIVSGNGTQILVNLFMPGGTIAAKIAALSQGTSTPEEYSSMFYLGVILLVLALVVNLVAQWIVRRGAKRQGL